MSIWRYGAWDVLADKVDWDESKHPRHPAGSDKGGEFAPKRSGNRSLKLPLPLFNATGTRSLERDKERRRIMEEAFPGVRFSLYHGNLLGVREGKRHGVPGSGQPQAIMDWRGNPGREDLIPTIVQAGKRWGKVNGSGYVTLNTLKIETGFDYLDIISAINALRARDPYAIQATVNRLGDSVYLKFV